MNRRNLRRLSLGAGLTMLAGVSAGLLDAPAQAATAGSWAELVSAFDHATGVVTVDLTNSVTQPTGAEDLAVPAGVTITLDLHHNTLNAIAQTAGHAGVGLPETAKLIVTDSGGGAPGALVATGGSSNSTTGTGAGAGIGGNGLSSGSTSSGTLIVLSGQVIANGGAATQTDGGGAGAGVGGSGGNGTGTAPGTVGGELGPLRVAGGSLVARGGNAASNSGAGAGIGGGGGGSGAPNNNGGIGGNPGILPWFSGNAVVTATGGSVAGAGNGGAGAGFGGGGGGYGNPNGGDGGLGGSFYAYDTAVLSGVGGTSIHGGGGAGIGAGGGAAGVTNGGAGGAGVGYSAESTVTINDSREGADGTGAGHGTGGVRSLGGPAPYRAPYVLSLADPVGGRVHRGQSFTYTVTAQLESFSTDDPGALTVQVSLPRGVITSGSPAGGPWACSVGAVPQIVTCTWTDPVNAPSGTLLPISVPVTVVRDVAVHDNKLTASATVTATFGSSTTATDTVTLDDYDHYHH